MLTSSLSLRTGGLAIYLNEGRVVTVAEGEISGAIGRYFTVGAKYTFN